MRNVPPRINIAGHRFGRLTAISYANDAKWLCVCDCGTQKSVDGYILRSGKTLSCGCYMREISADHCRSMAVHNRTGSPEYRTWVRIRWRCNPKNKKEFPHYAGKGIEVCDRWKVFDNFLVDMGDRPSKKHSIERKNYSGNYEPSNCIWATIIVQANNRSNNRIVVYRNQPMSLANAIRSSGISIKKSTVRLRLEKGWTIEQAIEEPIRYSTKELT
jgi:hypothetical protein